MQPISGFVLDGQLHSVYASPDGEEVVTQVATTRESFGQPALFAPIAKRIVSVVSMVSTDLTRLPRDPLLGFVEMHPAALRRLLESMSILVLSQSHLFSQVAFHDVRGRVAYRLLKLRMNTASPSREVRGFPSVSPNRRWPDWLPPAVRVPTGH